MLITVVEYNLNWPKAFEQEASQLKGLLGDLIVNIHHIGSTSVPGLMAKPIIDILLEVTNLGNLDTKSTLVEGLGYEVMGEMGIPGRRYFRKGGYYRTHQIHAFVSGDSNLERHIAFRDYLIAHKEVAEAYGALKLAIARKANNNIESYSDAKDPFIKLHEPKALEWYKKFK